MRLSDHFLDPGVFIRSMASRGALGGLSEAALQVALVMDAAGKDDVLIETVGVGQAEIDIVDHADTIVLALMPGSGDSIQALKAGVMEIPDVIVVNKADHPMTDTMVREVRSVLALSQDPEGWKVPILRTEAARGEGVEELATRIDEHRAFIEAAGTLAERRARNLRSEVLGIATSRMRRRLEADRRRGSRAPPSCWTGSCGASSTRPGRRRAAGAARRWLRRRRCPRWRRRGAGSAPSSPTLDGAAVGEVHGLFVDERERRAGLADRRLGAPPRHQARRGAAAPLRRRPLRRLGRAGGGRARARAPVVDPTRPLRREHELTICAHFGIGEGVGRAAEVAGRPARRASPPRPRTELPTGLWRPAYGRFRPIDPGG